MQYKRGVPRLSRDFVVVCPERSGSHMLGSALDSHPQIRCLHKIEDSLDETVEDGIQLGQILHSLDFLYEYDVPTDKIIILTREAGRIFLSRKKQVEGAVENIYREGGEMIAKGTMPLYPTMQIAQEVKRLKDFARDNNLLTITYEELCGGNDVAAIDFKTGRKICNYLGLKVASLRTTTEKLS